MIPSDLTGALLGFRVILGVVATLQSGTVHQMDADVEKKLQCCSRATDYGNGWVGAGLAVEKERAKPYQ